MSGGGSSQGYLQRRANRVRQHDYAVGEMDEAIDRLSEAALLEALERYIPTLEKVVSEHKRDSVGDHNLALQHERETPTLEASLAKYQGMRNDLISRGYRRTYAQSWEQDKHEESEYRSLVKKVKILGVIPFILGVLIMLLGVWQIGLFLILVGAVCRLAPVPVASLLRNVL